MVKVTFTFDEATVDQLRRAADRLRKPQSQVVREAIRDYAARVGKLSEEERARLLKIFDTVVPAIPRRPLRAVERELSGIRAARRQGGRRPSGRAR
ncbi:MAG: ribbon-helix-helix protein, CopG family [Candidatus Rokubacteria bacterium]|nr:ribbon-helix-helix protein, CopG family [Candidatus Rokubacteria bacterium]